MKIIYQDSPCAGTHGPRPLHIEARCADYIKRAELLEKARALRDKYFTECLDLY